jgi:hypothetical protein
VVEVWLGRHRPRAIVGRVHLQQLILNLVPFSHDWIKEEMGGGQGEIVACLSSQVAFSKGGIRWLEEVKDCLVYHQRLVEGGKEPCPQVRVTCSENGPQRPMRPTLLAETSTRASDWPTMDM